jgi:nitroimidazol reductase NimA-like FMN-containing flavoprotein (pyridoxamine 5'-phosphate oxidase superfamily)
MSIRLNEGEAWSVIEDAHTGILTTLRADGSPVTLPMWFVVIDRSVCVLTFPRTKKVARIANDPRAAFLVESGERWAELCAVHLSGHLEPVLDDATMQRIDLAMDEKYGAFRTARAAMPASARDQYATKRFFRLVPEHRMLTWDNSRLELKETP